MIRIGGPVTTIAHRGDWRASRENTLPAIVEAVRAGADVVEIDAKVSADGEVVLIHDADLQRLWGDPREVAASSYAEISAVAARGPHQIPTLTSALALIGGTGTALMIDLDAEQWAEPAWRVVRAAIAAELVTPAEVIWCGLASAMAVIRTLDADARMILSWDESSAGGRLPGDDLVERLEPEAFNPHWPMIDAQLLGWARQRELAVCCWTVDEPELARSLLELGVDAMISNRIRMLRQVVRDHEDRSSDDRA